MLIAFHTLAHGDRIRTEAVQIEPAKELFKKFVDSSTVFY